MIATSAKYNSLPTTYMNIETNHASTIIKLNIRKMMSFENQTHRRQMPDEIPAIKNLLSTDYSFLIIA